MLRFLVLLTGALLAGLGLSVLMTWAGNRSVVQNIMVAVVILVGLAIALLAIPFFYRAC